MDVVIAGSQKGWMVPPGLTMLAVSQEAWKAHAVAKMPRTYWDFSEAKKYVDKGQTPWTPAVSMVYAFDVALDMILGDGMPAVFAKHERYGDAARAGVKSIGLSVFADEKARIQHGHGRCRDSRAGYQGTSTHPARGERYRARRWSAVSRRQDLPNRSYGLGHREGDRRSRRRGRCGAAALRIRDSEVERLYESPCRRNYRQRRR